MSLAQNKEAGFTLMELTISIVIMGILTLVGYGVIALNANTFNMVNSNTIQRWDVRKAMQQLKKDCQMIKPELLISVSGGGVKTDNLSFRTLSHSTIYYRRNASGVLQKKVGSGSWRDLVDHLTVAPFRFLNSNLTPTGTKADIKFIEVDLNRVVDSDNFQLTEQFYVRN